MCYVVLKLRFVCFCFYSVYSKIEVIEESFGEKEEKVVVSDVIE